MNTMMSTYKFLRHESEAGAGGRGGRRASRAGGWQCPSRRAAQGQADSLSTLVNFRAHFRCLLSFRFQYIAVFGGLRVKRMQNYHKKLLLLPPHLWCGWCHLPAATLQPSISSQTLRFLHGRPGVLDLSDPPTRSAHPLALASRLHLANDEAYVLHGYACSESTKAGRSTLTVPSPGCLDPRLARDVKRPQRAH